MVTQESVDTAMTPTVEIEQPLLEAPEVSDLARQTKLEFALEGMVLTLLDEEEEQLGVRYLKHDHFLLSTKIQQI